MHTKVGTKKVRLFEWTIKSYGKKLTNWRFNIYSVNDWKGS